MQQMYPAVINSLSTADQLHGKYRHELRMINAEGAESVLAIGQIQIYNSFTKDL